jgi:signal peptidase II
MSEPTPPSRNARLLLCGACLVGALGLDLVSKAWAWETLQGRPGIVVQPGVLVLDFAFNTGSAFGMLADADWARTFFIIVTLAALVYLARLATTLPTRWGSAFVALGLIMGGALGNLHDRLLRIRSVRTYFDDLPFSELLSNATAISGSLTETRHYAEIDHYGVVDFIVVYYWPHRRWPAFNVADIALTVGVALFMLYLHRRGGEQATPPENATEG